MVPDIIERKIALGHPVFYGDYNLNLVAERLDWVPGTYNDLFYAAYQIGARWAVHCWPCSTIPHQAYLRSPVHPEGTAILQAGHHAGSHEVGWHPGVEARPRRRALTARGALPVWRDGNQDDVIDTGKAGEAYGINIHDGIHLAGCIGLPKPAMVELMAIVDLATPHQGLTMSLTLVDP